jgi:lipid-A-disaccharide synthase
MQEVKAHLPVLLETAKRVPGLVPVVGLAPGIPDEVVSTSGDGVRLTRHIHDLLAHAVLVVAASGTVTLEAALLQSPMIVVYKTGLLSGLAARLLLRLPYVAMVNVVAGKMVVPEYLQGRCRPDLLAEQVRMLVSSEERLRSMRHELALVAEALGPRGASARAAQTLAQELAYAFRA